MIRPLTPADAASYRTVRLRALWEQPPAFGSMPMDEPDTATLADRLGPSRDDMVLGAFAKDQLVGILRLRRCENPSERHRATFAGLYVMPPFRGKGLGRGLVMAALERAKSDTSLRRITLGVVTTQEFAIRLYENVGFRRYGLETESFSSAGVFHDEFLMSLELRDFASVPGTPPHLNYRHATEHDCLLLAELNQQLIHEEGHRHRMTISELKQRLSGWLAGEHRAIIFETHGSLAAYVLFLEQAEQITVLQLFVMPAHRGKGLDRRAVELLHEEVWAPSKRMSVDVLTSNAKAVAFWRSFGYGDHALTLEK